MSAGTSHTHLHVAGDSPVHRLAPEVAIVGLVAFAIVVAVTPREHVGVFVAEALVLVAVVAAARLRPALVLRRLAVIVPFLLLAVLMPFVVGGDTVDVLGLDLSGPGLWAAWNLTAKATLGATASIVFAATNPLPDVLSGLARLRVPAAVTGIVSFMFRYLEVTANQLQRMRTAMVARAHDPRWLWQLRPLASSVGTLFVRSYEQGERTHRAMLARGFSGQMPALDDHHAHGRDWWRGLLPAAVALTALLLSVTGVIDLRWSGR